MTPNRRDVLRLGLGALAAASVPQHLFAAEAKKIPLFLQMYSVRKTFQAEPERVMAAVAAMGYDGVEYVQPRDVRKLRKMQDDNGLKCNGSHLSVGDIIDPEKFKQTIENHHILGGKFMICSWMDMKSKEVCIENAKKFSEAAELAAKEGLFVGYHAHGHDFQKMDGDLTAWEVFADNSTPAVLLQMDTSNCTDDPYRLVAKYPGRGKTIHLKETGNKIMGDGTIDWKRFWNICETVGGVQTYTIEYESSDDPEGGCAKCAKYYRAHHG
ncbi:MAG: TIM barrel protein [Planctomycetia bacterium]|nr:TIM barrel protein [Planctomycetia bacterium]